MSVFLADLVLWLSDSAGGAEDETKTPIVCNQVVISSRLL